MKVAINRCYGGFGLSEAAVKLYAKKKGFEVFAYHEPKYGEGYVEVKPGDKPLCLFYFKERIPEGYDSKAVWELMQDHYFADNEIARDDPTLVEVVEELGEVSWGRFAELKVIEIPDGISWEIDDYDGMESVKETHRSWY